jgi:hypothetical protein
MLDEMTKAISNIDWSFVTLSRLRYDGSHEPVAIGERRWQERQFAYEIYHQLRCLWREKPFEAGCVLHPEVLKTYQEIRHLNKMPDFLFHIPDTKRNLAVVEIKLASNPEKKLEDDLDKLALFGRALRYESLIEILIGYRSELDETKVLLNKLNGLGETPISIACLSLDDHRLEWLEIKHQENRRIESDGLRR